MSGSVRRLGQSFTSAPAGMAQCAVLELWCFGLSAPFRAMRTFGRPPARVAQCGDAGMASFQRPPVWHSARSWSFGTFASQPPLGRCLRSVVRPLEWLSAAIRTCFISAPARVAQCAVLECFRRPWIFVDTSTMSSSCPWSVGLLRSPSTCRCTLCELGMRGKQISPVK